MINFSFSYQAVFNIEFLISNHVCQVDIFKALFNTYAYIISLTVTCISMHILVFPSLTRCGTTAAIDPVCDRLTSESSVLLNVTHGEVYANLSYSVLSLSLIESHCNNSDECDQFSVSISFVRYRKYIFIIKSTEILSLPWKPSKVTRNLVLQMISKVQNFLDQTIFKRGLLSKNDTFFLRRKIFPSLTKSRACFEIP